jgi:hypothetical protein
VTEAWEDCFEHDPACEEAAAALIRGYAGDGRRELAVRVHERCAAALGELGLRIPASLAEPLAAPPVHAPGQVREEVRTVTILSAEVAAPPELGLEGMRDALAASLTAVVAEAEALGGTLMSLSGSGHAFANTEAIASYRGALALLDSGTEAARLNAKLANVLWRTARRAEARDAFAAGLRQVDEADVVFRAHLLTRLGRLEMVENRGAVAMRAFDDAEALLAPLIAALLAGDVAAADDETAEQWLELMVDGRADLLAISGQEDLALATLRAVQPVLEVRGSPARKCSFYHVRATARILRNRYRVDEADIEDLKLAAAAAAGSEEKDLAYAMFFVGWGLLLHDDLTAARDYLEQSLTLAERIGEAVLVGECLVNLGITAVRRHDTEAVGSLVDRAQAAAIPTSGLGLPAEASACLVWLAWQDGRPAEVIALAARIAAGDRTTYHVPDGRSPHDWVYLLPLIATHLDAGNVEAAVAAARRLLDPGQLHLPDPLDAALAAACTAWDHGDPVATASTLKAALIQADELRYC